MCMPLSPSRENNFSNFLVFIQYIIQFRLVWTFILIESNVKYFSVHILQSIFSIWDPYLFISTAVTHCFTLLHCINQLCENTIYQLYCQWTHRFFSLGFCYYKQCSYEHSWMYSCEHVQEVWGLFVFLSI